MKEELPKPIVVASKCLGFAHCRYDGQMLENPLVAKLQKYVEFQPVCPEMEIGLGVPRNPIRIVEMDGKQMLHQPATGKDVTECCSMPSADFPMIYRMKKNNFS